MKKVTVISAHPDDETLGVGGTILRHLHEGDDVSIIFVTNISENQGFSRDVVERRQVEIRKVLELYGISNFRLLDYPTMTLTQSLMPDLIADFSKFFTENKTEVLYCLNRSDAHSDHRIIFEAAMACTKSFRYPDLKKVLMYECISETEFAPALAENAFLPNYFVDISEYMDKKIGIMKVFESEMGDHPFPRSEDNIRALATFRGAVAGVKYAEAFQLIKWIES